MDRKRSMSFSNTRELKVKDGPQTNHDQLTEMFDFDRKSMIRKYEFDLLTDRPIPHPERWEHLQVFPGQAPEYYFRPYFRKKPRPEITADELTPVQRSGVRRRLDFSDEPQQKRQRVDQESQTVTGHAQIEEHPGQILITDVFKVKKPRWPMLKKSQSF